MSTYQVLTDYLSDIETDNWGEWIIDKNGKGTFENPTQMPYVSYSSVVQQFINDIYDFADTHPEYGLYHYNEILEQNHIAWKEESVHEKDVSAVDSKCILALLIAAVRSERFCDGILLDLLKNGAITKWLKRLKEIENTQQ